MDAINGDGDCAFTSILLQLRKAEWQEQNENLMQHLRGLGLGLTIDENVFQLCQLFLNHVQSNDYYQMLTEIPLLDINAERERFREEGTFCGEVGDLVVKVRSNILQVAIVIMTSMAGSPFVYFIQDETP